MPYKVELEICHDGYHWIAKNNDIHVRAKEMKDLDKEIIRKVQSLFRESNANYIDVSMAFDNQVVPEWIRQYSNHYFNRRLRVIL
jgi:hypothetical protein